MALSLRWPAFGFTLAACLAAAGCDRPGGSTGPRSVERARPSMGSELRLTAWTAAPRALDAFEEVFREFDRLEALMTVWRDDSDVARINAAAGQHPVAVSPDTLTVLRQARQVSDWTGGKFDVTFGVLNGLWRFDHDQDNSIPDRAEVQRRLPLIDYHALRIDDPPGTAFLTRPGMRVNLGGIGKGYAIDRGAEIFRRHGLRDFLIQAGGDMLAAGRKDGRPWRLGIQDPRGPANQIFAAIDLTDSTFSTSGDYERAFVKDGVRYHHIIDPATGQPASGCRSVTILTDRAVLADGLSTGVFLLGPKDGLALVERLPNVDAVIVTSGNEVLTTARLKGRLELLRKPTDAP